MNIISTAKFAIGSKAREWKQVQARMFLLVSIILCFPEILYGIRLFHTMLPAISTLLNEFNCPISLELMTDPVVASDGFTYDRESIAQWLFEHNTSPTTNEPLETHDLFKNRALLNLIRESQLSATNKVECNGMPQLHKTP